MVKEIIYCDRCGKEVEYQRNNRGFRFHVFKLIKLRSSHPEEHLDICQSCYDSLKEWWETGKK